MHLMGESILRYCSVRLCRPRLPLRHLVCLRKRVSACSYILGLHIFSLV